MHFFKGVSPWFLSKNGDFLIFSFYAKWIKRVFFEGSEGKEAFLDHKKTAQKTTQNFHFFKGVSPWFLSKNGDFLIFSFLCKVDEERVFYESSERKKKPF